MFHRRFGKFHILIELFIRGSLATAELRFLSGD